MIEHRADCSDYVELDIDSSIRTSCDYETGSR